MIKSRFLDFRVMTAFFTAVLLVSVLVISGCSSNKKDETEPAQKTETEATVDTTTAPPSEGSVTEQPTPGPGRTSHGPPQEIVDACNGMSQGDACTVTMTGGMDVHGACKTLRSGEMACIPQPRPGKAVERPQSDENVGKFKDYTTDESDANSDGTD